MGTPVVPEIPNPSHFSSGRLSGTVRLHAPIQFFSGAGLVTVANWATKSPDCGGTYRSVGQTTVWESTHDDVVMALPTEYDVPKTPKLEILKLALSRSDSDEKFPK